MCQALECRFKTQMEYSNENKMQLYRSLFREDKLIDYVLDSLAIIKDDGKMVVKLTYFTSHEEAMEKKYPESEKDEAIEVANEISEPEYNREDFPKQLETTLNAMLKSSVQNNSINEYKSTKYSCTEDRCRFEIDLGDDRTQRKWKKILSFSSPSSAKVNSKNSMKPFQEAPLARHLITPSN